MATTVMWFRRDLRLADNPALLAALGAGDEVVPLFVLDDALRRPSGPPRLAFLDGCLRALRDATGGRLAVRAGRPEEVVPAVAAEVGAAEVFAAADFGPYGRRRDDAVAAALADGGRRLRTVGSPYAVPPGTLATGDGRPFRVYSPFLRAWRATGWDDPRPAPPDPRWAAVDRGDLPAPPPVAATLPVPGEAAAAARLEAFLAGPVADYADRRNDPGADATSRLSPYLRWGCLHPRQVLARLGDGRGPDAFRRELAWRDFYADVLLHRPDSARHPLQRRMATIEVDDGPAADERFAAWAEGRTGYPVVDAGMRQLAGEAWVHNRVRMIVASFLVKDLHLDWRRGARLFLGRLVDGDLASNHHGWQWVAGTGTDPAPYVRVFNPVLQGRRFDPDGDYVRRWVPELRGLAGGAVHEPWAAPGGPPAGYPAPIVDHAAERRVAIARYEGLAG